MESEVNDIFINNNILKKILTSQTKLNCRIELKYIGQFIVNMRGGNPHLTGRFCKDELGPEFQHGIRACRIQGPPKPIHALSPKSVGREGGVLGKIQVPHRIDKTLEKSI
ncbi:hypothetical protein MTR_1g034040 [Medicago truncatula]|uniref:Uncharacterized protein n=1 Tax=Medicago truncatula TaxID=3880 RepID=A0A072VG13_MEDTR|nr:hypothetical protein MTR_1g034040 [Medicago truncatula]